MSPDGSPSGDGSFAKPWDLGTALAGPAAVTPGSTIWLRGGTYADGSLFGHGYVSTLTGSADAPIVVRQYPGERATVTKFLTIRGAYTWYWGFEIVHPAPHAGYAHGVNDRGPGTKLINLVVHDASASGIFIGPEATDAEVYGSIVYNNGRTDKFDHGIYCQSRSRLVLRDNIVFDNWAVGIHCYVEPEHGPEAALENIQLAGNVAFNNSVWALPREDILVGGERPASGIRVEQNYTYRSVPSAAKIADVGYDFVVNEDVVLANNYLVGGWLHIGRWTSATITGNTLFNPAGDGLVWILGDLSGHDWSGNTFFGDPTAPAWRHDTSGVTTFDEWRVLTGLSSPGSYAGPAPTGVEVTVRPNRYEPGRAHIIVYNWARQSTVTVAVAEILTPGEKYIVKSAQDFYGPPVATGVYTGNPITLSMVGATPPAPLGVSAISPPATGPTFQVFVLLAAERGLGPCRPVRPEDAAICPSARRAYPGEDLVHQGGYRLIGDRDAGR
ncbi:MAG TPA: right-handed parallel beta-helix repeat-containing protein [Gemmatimonadales bacterium]|nr:right-handed parallel beta-helix repeat-containing protein [Gemmatimonadales bacterium]